MYDAQAAPAIRTFESLLVECSRVSVRLLQDWWVVLLHSMMHIAVMKRCGRGGFIRAGKTTCLQW